MIGTTWPISAGGAAVYSMVDETGTKLDGEREVVLVGNKNLRAFKPERFRSSSARKDGVPHQSH